MSMQIEVRLFATFRDHLPPGSQSFSFKKTVDKEATVQEIIDELQLPLTIPKIIIVNGRHADAGYRLSDGDVVSIFPPVAGG